MATVARDINVPNKVFDRIHAFVLRWEGGLCEDKDDAGGITKYGVSLRFLQSVQPGATRIDIINMTVERGKELFRDNFWTPNKCDKLPKRVAAALYDTAVNVGSKQAVKFLQRALGVTDDGVIGEQTLDAVTRCSDKRGLCEAMLNLRVGFYKRLASNKPSQQTFLRGWVRRAEALKKELENDVYVERTFNSDDHDVGGANL